MLVKHRDQLRPIHPDTVETRTLQLLVEDRRQLVNERVRISNHLVADLKSYYPQVLQWFEKTYAPVTLDFLARWPALQELQKVRPASRNSSSNNTNAGTRLRTKHASRTCTKP